MASSPELPPPTVSPEEVRRSAADVLTRSEYADAAPSLVDQVREWVLTQLARLLQELVGAGTASFVGSVVLGLSVLGALALLVRLLASTRSDPAQAGHVIGSVGRSAAHWAADAAAAEQAQRWREAVRCHYRALLAELAAAGIVDETPGRTAGEYRAEVAQRVPGAGDAVSAATAAFEDAWYSEVPVERADVDAFVADAEAVRVAAGLRAPVTASVAR